MATRYGLSIEESLTSSDQYTVGGSRQVPGIRIYAFAKKLGLDNKQLLEVCEKVGIKGKGSALASLEENEVAKVENFLSGGGGAAPASTATTKKESASEKSAPSRDDNLARRGGSVVDLDSRLKKSTGKPTEPSVEDELPPVEEEPDLPESDEDQETVGQPETPTPPLQAAEKKSKPVLKPRPAATPKPTVDPNAPVRPSRLQNSGLKARMEIRSRGGKPAEKPEETAKKQQPPRKRSGPVIRMAAMPKVEQPTKTAKVSGEKVQKPDIALPQDAIKQARSGSAAPLEQFTKSKTKPKKEPRKGSKPGAGSNQTQTESNEAASTGSRKGGRRPSAKEKGEVGAGMSTIRQQRSRRRRQPDDDRGGYRSRRQNRRRSGPVANTAAPRKDDLVLQLPCSVRELSVVAGIPAVQVLLTAQSMGDDSAKTINSMLSDETAELLITNFNIENVEIRQAESLEDAMLAEFESEDAPESLHARPPIVTFLGHVDHGKTSLLDAIIGIDVVSGESGGITQHIRAYQVDKDGQKIAFVDTPGHEAFTEMRARGANVTDIAVLVVAADDGVMPQTEEAISHAKAAGVPIIVALNKIDLPGANQDKAFQDLAQHDLLPSEWGGETEVVKTSAIKGDGISDLLDMILLTAELHEYKANAARAASGTCIEAEQQSDKGVVAKIMVQNGTLKIGDIIVCGSSYGRVKAMHNTLKPKIKIKEAGPSTPVNLTGLDKPPGAGDKIYVLPDIAAAREIAEKRAAEATIQRVGNRSTKMTFEEIQRRMETGDLTDPNAEVYTLNLIIRADVRGSIEAIQKELGKISHPEVKIKILQALPGGVTVGDVRLAEASEAIIVGFNVVPDEAARSLAEDLQVEIRRYDIIYKITDDLRALLEGKLKPEEQVVEQGMAMVLQTFSISKTGTIAGCRVMRGSIQRECRMRIIRESRVIGDYAIDTLKRVKDDAKEVQRGMECGIKLAGFNDIKEGDTLEAYKIQEVARTL